MEELKLRTVKPVGTVIYTYEYRDHVFFIWKTEANAAPAIVGAGWNLHFKDIIPQFITNEYTRHTNFKTRNSAAAYAIKLLDEAIAYYNKLQ